MSLNGKKGFCFVALKHHSRFLLPITRVLEAQGVSMRYLTAPAELPFELTLMEEGLPYCHPASYLTSEVADRIEAAYRQVRAAWRQHVLSSTILHHFTLPVQDKILRMHVENFYLFRHIFELERPDFVLVLHELNSWGKMLGYLCHEYGVPFITLQEGLYYAPAAVYRFHTEYSTACLVWGDATREVLVRSGGSADKIFVVGNTHLAAAIEKAAHPAVVRETKEELHLDPNKKVVTVLMGGLGYQEEFSFPVEFLDWARRRADLTLICKWHPVTNKTVLERIARTFQEIPTLHCVQQYDTYRLLAASDVCVVFGNSTTGLEALAFGKPLVEVQLAGLEYSFSAMGVAERATDLTEVPAAVQRLLDNGLPPERADKVREYLLQNLSTLNGDSVERAVAVIERVLYAQEEHRRRCEPVVTHLHKPEDKGIRLSTSFPQEETAEYNCTDSAECNDVLSENGQREYGCSIIIPLLSAAGVEETLMGIATHTPADLSYECILSSAHPEEVRQLFSGIQGDIRLLAASRPSIAHLCNTAARVARGQYLCFVSPGMIPQKGWLKTLLKELDTESNTDLAGGLKIGIVGGKTIFANGLLAHAGVAFDANCSLSSLYRLLPATLAGANKTRIMSAVTGCVLIRREVFMATGEMDEGFQRGWHDVDFCLQAKLAGWQTLYTPHSVCLTLKPDEEKEVNDRLRFYSKWVGSLWPNEEQYWQEDGLDNKKLQQFYQAQMG